MPAQPTLPLFPHIENGKAEQLFYDKNASLTG
jgi:hypothetical protein